MAAVLHGSARATPRVRAVLQAAQASSRAIAAQYGLNPKTVLKWRKRSITVDAPTGPKARSTVLTEAEEAIVVEFRRRTLLPLGCVRDAIPRLLRARSIAASRVIVSPVCPKTRTPAQNVRRSRKPRSAMSTSTAPNSYQPRAKHT